MKKTENAITPSPNGFGNQENVAKYPITIWIPINNNLLSIILLSDIVEVIDL